MLAQSNINHLRKITIAIIVSFVVMVACTITVIAMNEDKIMDIPKIKVPEIIYPETETANL